MNFIVKFLHEIQSRMNLDPLLEMQNITFLKFRKR